MIRYIGASTYIYTHLPASEWFPIILLFIVLVFVENRFSNNCLLNDEFYVLVEKKTLYTQTINGNWKQLVKHRMHNSATKQCVVHTHTVLLPLPINYSSAEKRTTFHFIF